MSGQLYQSRSHHNLRSQYYPPSQPRSSRPPASFAQDPSPSSHQYAQLNEYGQRRQQAEPSRSLRPVASSSRLPRQISREDMPPPPVPFPRQRPPPQSHHQSVPYAQSRSNRHEMYDQAPPSSSSLRTREPQQPRSRPSPPSPERPVAATQYIQDRRQPSADHQVILDRMRQNGWHSVGGGGGGNQSEDTMSHRSTSSSSSAGDEQYRSESLSKTDSGYSDGEERTAGEKVLEGWSALKKAVAGFAGEGATENGQGAQIWNRLTTSLAASVGTVQDKWNTEDDGSVGPDGETKLGRTIKTYHLSRVESAEDVPEWLLNDAERARYSRKLSHARSTQEFDRPSQSRLEVGERPLARQYHSEEHVTSSRMTEGQSQGRQIVPQAIGGGSRGSAADRLQRMREERRLRGNV
ncbi:hypothetical protein JCM5353_000791 [Sporobolomyces roseus]